MAFEVYFHISKTAIEIVAVAAVAYATAYAIKDLMSEEEAADPVINPIEG